MPFIEGIGDEVFNCLLIVFIVVLVTLGWRSTNITETPLVRTVLILEPRHHASAPENTTSTVTLSPPQDTGQSDPVVINDTHPETVDVPNTASSVAKSQSSAEQTDQGSSSSQSPEGNAGASGSLPTNTVEALVNAENPLTESTSNTTEVPSETSNPNELRRRRLQFFDDRQGTENVSGTHSAQSSCPASESGDHVQASTSSGVIQETLDEQDSKGSETVTSLSEPCLACDDIRIRLKFLNDNQKLVQGKLQEPLGDFKRRNFAVEIESSKVIRLIFNGQVLQSDDRTLQNYGLFDNCVVHCLVHNQRSSGPNVDSTTNINTGEELHFGGGDVGEAREWDLSNVMYVSMFVILSAIWYLRINFSQLFSATSTVALFGLSGIFVIFLVGMYIPDQEVLRT